MLRLAFATQQLYEFNNNIRCIEMVDIITWDWIKKKFNNNIRCIEMGIQISKKRNETGLITT